ncbi:MAG: NAD(P)-dependent oxidoreductase [Rhodoglobus sp.]
MTQRGPGEHLDPLASTGIPVAHRPEAGPIAILPEEREPFLSAVKAGGGVVAPLSAETRGLLWLGSDAAELIAVLRAHPAIGWVQLQWAGVDGMAAALAEYADDDSPIWTSAKGAYSEPVAEHALALMLAVLRGLPEKTRSHSWASPATGISLFGRTVVIVGAGGIAVELIRLLAPFDVSVTIVRRTPGELAGADRVVTVDRLAEVLPDADVLVVAAAATDSTAMLIGAPELALMKPSAALVNIARGSLVDSMALAAALERGQLAGAGLDVTSPEPLPDGHPLWSAPRVVITSHSADTKEMVEPLLAERLRLNVAAFLHDGAFIGVVDPGAGY